MGTSRLKTNGIATVSFHLFPSPFAASVTGLVAFNAQLRGQELGGCDSPGGKAQTSERSPGSDGRPRVVTQKRGAGAPRPAMQSQGRHCRHDRQLCSRIRAAVSAPPRDWYSNFARGTPDGVAQIGLRLQSRTWRSVMRFWLFVGGGGRSSWVLAIGFAMRHPCPVKR